MFRKSIHIKVIEYIYVGNEKEKNRKDEEEDRMLEREIRLN